MIKAISKSHSKSKALRRTISIVRHCNFIRSKIQYTTAKEVLNLFILLGVKCLFSSQYGFYLFLCIHTYMRIGALLCGYHSATHLQFKLIFTHIYIFNKFNKQILHFTAFILICVDANWECVQMTNDVTAMGYNAAEWLWVIQTSYPQLHDNRTERKNGHFFKSSKSPETKL